MQEKPQGAVKLFRPRVGVLAPQLWLLKFSRMLATCALVCASMGWLSPQAPKYVHDTSGWPAARSVPNAFAAFACFASFCRLVSRLRSALCTDVDMLPAVACSTLSVLLTCFLPCTRAFL